jgi:hypothetical protein
MMCTCCTVTPRIAGTEEVLKRIANMYERLVMPAEKSPEQLTVVQLNDDFRQHRHDWYITGSINWHKEKTFWKIDYYDQALEYWHDPLSPDCRRILTVLLASEY